MTLSSGDFDIDATEANPAVIKKWIKGWAWFIKNKSVITQTASGADSLTRLNDGELFIVPAWEDHLLGLQRSGAITTRLAFYVPEFGMPGGGNIAAVAANSPNPAASAIFLNWLVRPETQQALHQNFGTVPMNKSSQVELNITTYTNFYGKEYTMQLRKEFVRQVTMK